MSAIWAIILAAGESKRMGFPKMLLDFNGKSMLERVIENVKESDVDHIIIVLGAEMDKLMPLVNRMNVKYCYNDNYKKGMLSSVQCGIRNIPKYCEAVLVFQGDQPMISRE
jgi:molybdenum cofactor cytidylyltransferase